MTRRTDNRTTRSLVPASEIPDFTPVPIKPRSDGWESLFSLHTPARTSVRLASRRMARRPVGLAAR